MHTALAPPPGVLPVDADASPVRLHGEACWVCGAAAGPLQPIGEVATPTDGGFRIWPVVGCLAHGQGIR